MTAAAPALFRLSGLNSIAHVALWVVAATSSLAIIEPSPHDAILITLIVASVIVGLRIPRGIAPLAILMATFVAGDALGSAQATNIDAAMNHTLITAYLGAAAVFFACISAWQPQATIPVLLSGMVLAALVATVAGIAGYFNFGGSSAELFTLFGRVKGTFKDPNVYAPFLILPLLYCTAGVLSGRPGLLSWRLPVIGLLLAGMLLSFSRGGWLHLALSAALFFFLILGCVKDAHVRMRAILVVIVGLAMIAGMLAWALSFDEVGRLFAERASLSQSYDFGAQGRFAGQLKAISVIIAEPLGIGSTEFLRYHPEQPHDVYLNVFLNGGWIGGFAYLSLVVLTLWRGLGAVLRPGPTQILAIALFATFAGIAVEGLIVDTDHWRHFFLMIGLIWGVAAAPLQERV